MKNVIVKESVKSKVTQKEAIKLATDVRKIGGKVGDKGTLKRNILYKVLRNTIIIF